MPEDDCLAVCPHRQQLEHTLRHCQTQTEVLRATHDNYLSIIDEFKHDLDELLLQQQCQTPTDSERSSKDEPVPATILAVASNCSTALRQQNDVLTQEITCLQGALQDRDQQITRLNSMLDKFSDQSESNRLKEEIVELKQINCEQKRKLRELAGMQTNQEDQHVQLNNKYKELSRMYDNQSKELKRANQQVECLSDRISKVEMIQKTLEMERDVLSEETVKLKTREAELTGRITSLCNQLKFSATELDKSKKYVCALQAHIMEQEQRQLDATREVQCAKTEVERQMAVLSSDCNEMREKLKKQCDVAQQQELLLETFRRWKDAQIRSDEAMRFCVKRADDHIKILLEENERVNCEYGKLQRDYDLLDGELLQLRAFYNSRYGNAGGAGSRAGGSASASASSSAGGVVGGRPGNNVGHNMDERMEYLSSTTRRITEQCRTLGISHPKLD